MKIEKLGKNHRKEVIGGLIVISVIGILAFNLTKAKYQGIEDIELVKGEVNYKLPDFKMMAMYQNNNGSYEEKIALTKYCNYRDIERGSKWTSNSSRFNHASVARIQKNMPSFRCSLNDEYNLKVGLITGDEVAYAGGQIALNEHYYLCNGESYWTMTPDGYDAAAVLAVDIKGYINDYSGANIGYGIRPVINLIANISISNGNGTINNPYIVL